MVAGTDCEGPNCDNSRVGTHVLVLPAFTHGSPMNSVMQHSLTLESRMMVRRGSAMTKKAGGGEEGVTMTGIKKEIFGCYLRKR